MIRRLMILVFASAVALSGCSQVQQQVKKNQYRQQSLVRASCQSNLSRLSLALKMYQVDNDDKLPPVISGGSQHGWADALRLADISIFQCPSEPTPSIGNPRASGFTDYWFNSNLSGVKYSTVNSPATTILFGEGGGNDVTDARYAKSNLPNAWLTSANSPLKRHLGGSVYAYADGHTKWSKPEYLLKMVYGNGKKAAKFTLK